jgi:guanylate kinase
MSPDKSGRLVILSGPSCVGKSPLYKSLGKFYPDLNSKLHKLVLVNSRAPRPGELDGVDYHFRTRDQVEALRAEHRYAVVEARDDLQALDMEELESLLRRGDVFFEGNPYVGRALQTHPRLVGVNRLSIFLSPLSRDEIAYLKAPERNLSLHEFLTDVMRRKLLRRTQRQKGDLSAKDLENVETRASSAYRELQGAWQFQYVIPNHDGEDSDNWEAFYYLIGDARKTLDAFVGLLKGSVPPGAEQWEESLLPQLHGT